MTLLLLREAADTVRHVSTQPLPEWGREWGHCLTLYFDNHLPSVFASAVLRPQSLQKPE